MVPARRFRFEVFDDEGNRLQVIFEGRVSREKILQLIDLLELFGGVSPHPQFASSEALGDKMKRVFAVVRRRFPVGSFSSTDVKLAYEEMFGEPIELGVVSTYLARLAKRGLLERSGRPSRWMYSLRRVERAALLEA